MIRVVFVKENRHLTPEELEKMRLGRTGKPRSEAHCKALSQALKHKRKSKATREAIAKSWETRPHSFDPKRTSERSSASKKGKPQSEEWHRKNREYWAALSDEELAARVLPMLSSRGGG